MSENDSSEYDSELPLAKKIQLHYDTLQSSDSG